jgi:hypothetical protein
MVTACVNPCCVTSSASSAQRGGCRKIWADLGMKQDGDAVIDRVQLGHGVGALAVRGSRNRGHILKVELPHAQRRWVGHQLVVPALQQCHAPMLAQDLPNGARRAGEPQPLRRKTTVEQWRSTTYMAH